MITFRAARAVLAAALLTVAGCSAEQQDWRAAEAAGTSEAYQHFIEQHPQSELAGKARERVGEFAEDRDWQQVSKLGTADAYRGFLAAHPKGRWSQEARIRIESFALGSIQRMAPQTPGQTAGPATGVKLLRLASAAPSIPAGAVAAPAALPASQPPAPPAAAAPLARGYAVQLGAFGSEANATREWQRLESRFAPVLAGLSPQLIAAGTAAAPIYRLQAAARGEAQARAICDSLKAQSQPCVPVLPR
ncbi:MAG: SPOR domain-containing protein [Gammaproteobacteria bacterium]|nr:SPOR domain-containing protein [Gammaproteobacteria bacterium]